MKNLKILVVDDEEDLREGLVMNLDILGHSVTEASGGNEAFEKIQTGEFDLVVSDIQMPDGTGVELLQKANPLEKKPPHFVMISGYSQYTRQDILDLGAHDLLSKPFSTDALLSLIEDIFD